MNYIDRLLKCSDCNTEFVFTAGEQLFFFDKQFKNDPKRCKLCKSKRANVGKVPTLATASTLPLSRTETRTECSACGIETTVPFKPTQGRPVLCRQCFQLKRVPAAVAAVATMNSPAGLIATAAEAFAVANSGVVLHVLTGSTPDEVPSVGSLPLECVAEAMPIPETKMASVEAVDA